MSVLGKDLFDFQRSHTNTKVEFGASGYWVEMVPEMQPYGTVLTEILNLDVTPFQKLLDRLNTAVHEKNYDDAPRAYMDMQKGFGSLPLYRLYLMDFRYFGDMKIEEFVGEEVREAFAKYVINEEREIPSFMQQQIKDIQLIQERYAWFLDRVFANAVFEKKKGQRKESLVSLKRCCPVRIASSVPWRMRRSGTSSLKICGRPLRNWMCKVKTCSPSDTAMC